jgi:hypothetical protein
MAAENFALQGRILQKSHASVTLKNVPTTILQFCKIHKLHGEAKFSGKLMKQGHPRLLWRS